MTGTRLIRWLVPAAALALGSSAFAQVNFVTDFEAEATCSTACAATCALTDVLWQNVAGDGADWAVDANGTGSVNTGPSGDHTTGAGNYAYVEASAPCNPNIIADLVSADLVLPMGGNYRLEFWYHLYGTDLPGIQVDIDPDGGADTFTDNVFMMTDNQDLWQRARIDLSSYAVAGDATINIRIRGITGTGFTSDPAIDDISIYEYFDNDVFVASIDSPLPTSCNAGPAEAITVTIQNNGALPQSNFPVEYVVDGGATVSEMFTGTINPDTTASFTFATTADLSVLGPHNIQVYTALANDEDLTNDLYSLDTISATREDAFPSINDFEGGSNAVWVSGGTNNSWALATPANAIIAGAASGVMAWVTNPTGNYNASENSYVQSQCGYDLTTLSNPAIRLNIWWESEFSWDGANIMTSTDDGATWNLVGTFGDAYNWYTDNTLNGQPGGSMLGWTGRNGSGSDGYVLATHLLDGLAGNPNVLVRVNFGADTSVHDEGVAFDDIQIFDDQDKLELSGGGPRARLDAYVGGEVNVLTLVATVEAYGQDQTVDTVTVTNSGTIPDADITAVRLWADDGDGAFDPVLDTQVGVDQVFVGGLATFTPAATAVKWTPQRMFVSVDLDVAATPGTTFDAGVLDPLDVTVASGAPVTLLNNVIGAQYGVFGLVDTLPWTDAMDDSAVYNRNSVFGAGDFPTATTPGNILGTLTTVNDAVVDLADATVAPGPYTDPYMASFDFPAGISAGAVDYAFDLSTYAAANDLIWLRFYWNNTGQEDDDLSNVFVSLDGGATWAASVYRWEFGTPVPEGWNQETIDLSDMLLVAGLDYSNDMRIRFQAGGDEFDPADDDGLQIDEIWLGKPQEAGVTRNAVAIVNGGTDGLGDVPVADPVSLTYTLENTGHLPLVVDPALFATANETNVANVVISAPATNPIDPGASVTFDVGFDVTAAGTFSLDLMFNSDDPRLANGDYSFVITGAGAEPDVAISRNGSPVAAGGTDSVGTVMAMAQTLTYTVENIGSADLTIATTAVGGESNVTASTTQPGTLVLAPGATTTFDVTFTGGEGAFSFDVMVDSDDADAPYTFTVAGTGEALPGDGGGCCSTSDKRTPWGGLLLALFVGLLALRPRRRHAMTA